MTLGDYTRVNFEDTVTPLDETNMNNIDAKIEELDTFADDAESDMTAVEARATAIENDIDYPTAVKQKAIVDTGEDGGVEGGIFNGDFEYGSGSRSSDGWIGDKKYGWWLDYTASTITAELGDGVMKISTDGSGYGTVESSNSRSITFAGDTETLFPILPSTKYRLSCKIKTNNVATDSALMRIYYWDENYENRVAHTSTALTGTNDWTYVEIIFTTGANSQFASVQMANGVAGNISDAWFDDIKLEQIDTQAVNTQVDEIVSVSVEGVTTTDNIDQYLETSGNTYTLTTGIDEGATHRQTFTPTADRGDGKHLLTKIQALVAAVGTGDWTLVVHDAANNVLASTTIVNGSMSTGDVDFDVPAILDVGTAYHFHIYSTVADGTVTTTDNADLETVDYHAQFAKHTESLVISANDGTLDMTGVKLLTGATITVNADGRGRYEYSQTLEGNPDDNHAFRTDLYSIDTAYNPTNYPKMMVATGVNDNVVMKHELPWLCTGFHLRYETQFSATRTYDIEYSIDNINWIMLAEGIDLGTAKFDVSVSSHVIYTRFKHNSGGNKYIEAYLFYADIDCQAALPIFTPSTEVTTETEDLTLNPIDLSEDVYWKLNSDLTGWGSRTFSMLASEAAFESQAVSANYIYMYDSNGTTPWTWDERSGLVPPADRTSGTVTAKFLVGDNQIRSSVNDGSMKANVNLSWNEESLRAALNRLTALANLQYPIVVEVEDVPAIDLQDQPTGASAETGYTNDVTSLRQTTAGVAAIAYTGLLPRENQFSEWLDITVVCNDGDGTLQGKLYTVDGTLVETYADLESNPVIEISNPDYKYSRERLILQISASAETTSTAWSVTDIKWRYQYNG